MTLHKNKAGPGNRIARFAGASVLALGALLASPCGAAPLPAGDGLPLLADAQPLPDADLATLRGGFVMPGGLEINLGFRLSLDIDDRLTIATEFRPHWRSSTVKGDKRGHHSKPDGHEKAWDSLEPGELRLTLHDKSGSGGPATLGVGPDGQIEILAGNPTIQDIEAGKRYVFDNGFAAEVVQTAEGARVTAGGELPLVLTHTKHGLELSAGDDRTTQVIDRITPELIAAQLTNRRNHAQISQQLNVDVDLLNFSRTGELRSLHATSLRMHRLVNSGLIRALTPR